MTEPNTRESDNLALATRFLQAVEAGATGEALAAFFHPDLVQHELPNRLFPAGVTRDRAAVLASAARGAALMRSQRYTLVGALAQGDRVVLEVDWAGTLAVPLRDLPAGHELRARQALFLELRDGQIATMRHYDCFEPF